AHAAGIATARTLLAANDPLHAARVAAFAAVAKAQVDLAAAYRGCKWYETAADRLDLADRFDGEAAVRERLQLAAALPKTPGGLPLKGNALFRRSATARVTGSWKEGEDTLEYGGNKGKTRHEWVLDQLHDDCELSVEFRA